MRAKEIPRSEWASFLESFATQHRGWLANLERRQHRGGRLALLYDQPLEEIHVNMQGSGRIALVFGRAEDERVTEAVEIPSRIRFLETKPGAHAGLEIQSADGTSMLIRFRSAMPPEMIDGIAA